jgi:hypothetical protein
MRKVAKRRRPKKGRPTGLTKELHVAIVRKIEEVYFIEKAADLVGVPSSTVREWFERGLGNVEGRPKTPLFAAFAKDVTRARAEFVERRMRRIEAAGVGGYVTEETTETRRDGSVVKRVKYMGPDWRADGFLLERADRANFSRHSTQHIEGSLTVKHVDALALSLLGILRRYVPEDQLEAVGMEVGKAIDISLGTPRLQVKGPVQVEERAA